MKTITIQILTLVGAAAALALSGCNTVEGFGRDMQIAGDAVEDASEETQRTMR